MRGLARVAGEQPGQVRRLAQGCKLQHHTRQEVAECAGVLRRHLRRMRRELPEGLGGRRQRVAFERHALAVALADQQPVAQVGDQHQAVAVPVFRHLGRRRGEVHRFGRRLDLDDAARRRQRVLRRVGVAVELVGGEQPAVGVAGAQALELHHAAHLGLQGVADAIEQVVDGSVEGGLLGAAAEHMHAVHGGKKGGERFRGGHRRARAAQQAARSARRAMAPRHRG